VRTGADLRRHVVERPGEIRRLIQPGAIGRGECFGEAGAMRAELHAVRARLEHGDQTRAVRARAQRGQARRDLGRVMREIVVDLDARDIGAQLEPSLDTLETCERRHRRAHGNPRVLRGRDGRDGVVAIVRAGNLPAHLAEHFAVTRDRESVRALERLRAPAPACGAEARDRGPATHRQHFVDGLRAGLRDDHTATRNRADEVMNLPLDGGEIGKDVGVVVLEVGEHEGARPVMHELRTLVEESRVVFVGLDDEVLAAAETRRDAEVLRHPADEKTGREAGVLEDPCEHARRRRLAVRPCDGKHPPSREHVCGEPFRSRRIGQARIEHVLDRGIAARHDVTDDDTVRRRLEIGRRIAFEHRNAERFELRAHGRIHIAIRAAHAVTFGLGECGDATHERAAYAEYVDAHAAHDNLWAARRHGWGDVSRLHASICAPMEPKVDRGRHERTATGARRER
jgi:hypothetical protein